MFQHHAPVIGDVHAALCITAATVVQQGERFCMRLQSHDRGLSRGVSMGGAETTTVSRVSCYSRSFRAMKVRGGLTSTGAR